MQKSQKRIQPTNLTVAYESHILRLQREVAMLRQELASYKSEQKAGLASESEPFIVFSTDEATYKFDAAEIVYCQALGNYTRVFSTTYDPLIISKPLKEISQELQQTHVRCHQSFLVSLQQCKVISKNKGQLQIDTQFGPIPISRRRKKEVLALYNSRSH